ncbi:hypothetical protein L7F22_022794, partial [Adiantum nelumboides]|nr:hypothetical protein [Adiantum nelumboides]
MEVTKVAGRLTLLQEDERACEVKHTHYMGSIGRKLSFLAWEAIHVDLKRKSLEK